MKTGKNVDEKFKTHLLSMKTTENVDGKLENGFPSMKTAENVDDNLKSDLSSMKTTKNVDEKFKTRLSSMKRAKNVDDKLNNGFPSMKTAEIMDGSPNLCPHAARLPLVPVPDLLVSCGLAHLPVVFVSGLLLSLCHSYDSHLSASLATCFHVRSAGFVQSVVREDECLNWASVEEYL